MIKEIKKQYYGSLVVIIFSVFVIILAPMYFNNYAWQVMLIPLLLQIPAFLSSRSLLKKINGL